VSAAPGAPPAGPVAWPEGYRAAAGFAFDVDAESAVLFSSPGSEHRPGVMSHQAYGPLVGVPRILRILERHDVPATFFVPGYTAERYPGVVRDVVAAGHEVAHHGYLHESLQGAPPEVEARWFDRGLQVLERVAGVRPVGYRAPMWEPSWYTPELLHQRGLLYDSSLMDAEVPYELAVAGGTASVVEIPIHWSLDDWERYCYIPCVSEGHIANPREVHESWSAELEGLRADGGCFVLTSHPFVTGRPSRAAVLDALIGQALDAGDVWVASHADIAAHVRSLGLPPRILTAPAVPTEYRQSP
jgi:peptidoglycan/xylan/chitin deacetylase (PgdA/CDA1 family)